MPEETKLRIDEHRSAVCAVIACARILEQYDIPKLIHAIDRSETVGPTLAPTLWRDKSTAMLEDKTLLKAALPLWEMASKLERMADEDSDSTSQ